MYLAGSTYYFFINGALIGTTPATGLVDPFRAMYIGARNVASAGAVISFFNGRIEIRTTKGVARNTAAYTPPLGWIAG